MRLELRMVGRREILAGIVAGALAAGQVAAAQEAGQAPAPAARQDEGQTAAATSLADARSLAGKGKLDQALEVLDALAKTTPEEVGVERLRGIILYQKERLAEAQVAFANAAEQDATDRQSVEMEGITLYRLGKPAQAIPFLEKAHTMPGGDAAGSSDGDDTGNGANGKAGVNADPRYVLGLCYADAKRYDDARGAFAAQFGFAADSAEAYLVTARLLLRREFAEESARFAAKALEKNPALPLAHQLLGEVALARSNLPLAVSELEAEEKLNPLNGGLYDRLGDAYLRNGQFEEARTALNKAVLLEPNSTGPYLLLGRTLVKLGEPIAGLHYLNRALGMDPGNSTTHAYLGEAYRILGQTAEASREYKLAQELQHKNEIKPGPAR